MIVSGYIDVCKMFCRCSCSVGPSPASGFDGGGRLMDPVRRVINSCLIHVARLVCVARRVIAVRPPPPPWHDIGELERAACCSRRPCHAFLACNNTSTLSNLGPGAVEHTSAAKSWWLDWLDSFLCWFRSQQIDQRLGVGRSILSIRSFVSSGFPFYARSPLRLSSKSASVGPPLKTCVASSPRVFRTNPTHPEKNTMVEGKREIYQDKNGTVYFLENKPSRVLWSDDSVVFVYHAGFDWAEYVFTRRHVQLRLCLHQAGNNRWVMSDGGGVDSLTNYRTQTWGVFSCTLA